MNSCITDIIQYNSCICLSNSLIFFLQLCVCQICQLWGQHGHHSSGARCVLPWLRCVSVPSCHHPAACLTKVVPWLVSEVVEMLFSTVGIVTIRPTNVDCKNHLFLVEGSLPTSYFARSMLVGEMVDLLYILYLFLDAGNNSLGLKLLEVYMLHRWACNACLLVHSSFRGNQIC